MGQGRGRVRTEMPLDSKVSGESLGAKVGEAEGNQDKEEGQVLGVTLCLDFRV